MIGEDPAGAAVVVVNYGSHRLLELSAYDPGNILAAEQALIIVVDNYSTLPEREAITRLAADRGWELVPLPANRGFGAGVNAGVVRAIDLGADSVILLNPDAQLTVGVAEELHRHCLDHPDEVVTPRLITSTGKTYSAGSFIELDTGALRGRRPERDGEDPDRNRPDPRGTVLPVTADRTPWLTAACLAISTRLWCRVGGMAEDYFLYWEDVDLSVRCLRAGARLVVRDDLVAVHDEGGTQGVGAGGDGAKSDLYYRFNCRNRLLFAHRLLSLRRRLRWALATPRESWQIYLRGGRRQLLTRPSGLVAAVRGSLAGLGLLFTKPESVEQQRRRNLEQLSSPIGPRVLLAHPSADLYGSDRMMIESAEGLRADGCRVTVVLPYRGPLVAELEHRGFPVLTCGLPALRKSILNPEGLVRFGLDTIRHAGAALRLIRRHGADLVYVNTLVVPGWLLLARLAGRRVVCHIHEAERRLPRTVRRLLTAPIALADRVIANSRFTACVLAGTLPGARQRTEVVHNGLEFPAATPPREELAGRARLIFCGRLSARKGPQTAIAAVRELTDRGIDVELDLVGSPVSGQESFEAELRAQAAPLGDRVRFLGFRADAADLFAGADIALVPSVGDESYGNVAVEAAAAARPVVIAGQPGLAEAVGSLPSVRVVPPDRPERLADAISDVIKDWDAVAAAAVASADRVRDDHAVARFRRDLATVARSTMR
ncbi:MAG TPA: glycosyltransferase [Microlunatus sp.]|nr:glycosyltransferase [Microlunatus sp.]